MGTWIGDVILYPLDDVNEDNIITLKGHSRTVWSVQFSLDSKFVISASTDSTIRLWSTITRKTVRIFEGHNSLINSVRYNVDEKLIVSASSDKTVRLWSVFKSEAIKIFKGHETSVILAQFSADGQYIVSASVNGSIIIWSLNSSNQIRKLIGHTRSVLSVHFTSDSSYIVSGSYDKTVRIWEIETGKCVCVITLPTHLKSMDVMEENVDQLTLCIGDSTGGLYSFTQNIKKREMFFNLHWRSHLFFHASNASFIDNDGLSFKNRMLLMQTGARVSERTHLPGKFTGIFFQFPKTESVSAVSLEAYSSSLGL